MSDRKEESVLGKKVIVGVRCRCPSGEVFVADVRETSEQGAYAVACPFCNTDHFIPRQYN